MNQLLPLWQPSATAWADWSTVQWALLLATAALCGYACQRRLGLPKVVGYALVGTLAGLLGLGGPLWPLQGPVLFALELGVAVVLFECGARINARWFLHNPMVLAQSLLEAGLTYGAVFLTLRALGVESGTATTVGLITMAASPVVLTRVVADTHAAGPVTDRAVVLATLSTLYALTLSAAQAHTLSSSEHTLWQAITPVLQVLLVSMAVAALVLYLPLRLALRLMSPLSQNTAILLLSLITAATACASALGGSAPLAALLAGMLLKQLHPRPLPWSERLGTVSTLLAMLMFVLVSTVAAHAPWTGDITLVVLALVVVRLLAKAAGVGLGHWGSGASWRQAAWTACAMAPLSAVALLMVVPFSHTAPETGKTIASIALPAILLMELFGAIAATWALRRAGEARNTQGVRQDA